MRRLRALVALAAVIAGPAAAHPMDGKKLPPTKAAPQLKEARTAQEAARKRLAAEGRYGCCIRPGCAMCTQNGAACPCGANVAAGKGVCGECWEGWQAGRGPRGGDPARTKLRPRASLEAARTLGAVSTPVSELLQKDRAALDAAKRTLAGESRYSCCVRPGCDSCARAGGCPCGESLLAGKGVCGECLDGWNSGHGAFDGTDPRSVKLEAMSGGMMGPRIPGAGMMRHGSGTSWQPDASPMWMLERAPRAEKTAPMQEPPHQDARSGLAGARQRLAAALIAAPRSCCAGEEGTVRAVALQAAPPIAGEGPFPEVMPGISSPEAETPSGKPGWELALMGNAFLDYVAQGGPRGVSRLVGQNWAMGMASRPLGAGEIHLRLMMSLEPATIGNNGVPELFQTGEGLVDRQHPHDLFMEIAAQYQQPFSRKWAWSLYAAPVGEPALGPVAYPHRASAFENPQTPLAHHLQDSTHISYGVLTGGLQSERWKLEGSWFNGREPDSKRWAFDEPGLNATSVRLWHQPGPNWSFQASRGWLPSEDRAEPGTVARTTASATYARTRERGYLASSLIWGRNDKPGGHSEDSFGLEGSYNWADRNTLFGRIERLERDELFASGPLAGRPFQIHAFTLGYTRDVARLGSLDAGIGGSLTVYAVPAELRGAYGDFPVGVHLFLRLRPGRMRH